MGTNGAVRYVKVWIELLAEDEGGRRTPLDLSSEWPVAYRPQLRMRGGHGRLIDVEFVAGPSEPVTPGAGAYATIRLDGPAGAHAALVVGAEFDVLEGPRLIGHGRVTSR
jgi:translation elongation factor EF-Tu-like GTPase